MFTGWFCLGGTEIINNSRAEDYTRTSPCGANWFVGPYCEGLKDFTFDDVVDFANLNAPPYDYSTISGAPWADPMPPTRPSQEFMGIYCLSVDGLDDSTITAPVVERVVSGGVIGRQRDSSRRMRFRVLLTGLTEQGLNYGRAWLENALRESTCSLHEGGSCGTTSLTFLTMCPPRFVNDGGGVFAYQETMAAATRILHGVKCTTGLIKEQEFSRITSKQPTEVIRDSEGYPINDPSAPDRGLYGGIYEFTLTAETPRMIGLPRIMDIPVTGQYLIEDAPLNLVPTPSAELSSGTVEVGRNLSTNPSVETDGIGWAMITTTQSGSAPTPYASSARDTAQKSVGVASWRVRLLGNGSTAASGRAYIAGSQNVSIAGIPSGTRFSFSMWGYAVIMAGGSASTIHAMAARIEWLDGASATLRTDTIETITSAFGGHTFSRASILPPAGAVTARCMIRADVTWASSGVPASNSDIMLYSDALALTVP